MKLRYVFTTLVCALLLIVLMAIITMRAHTEPIEPPAIHTEAPEADDAETESILVREAPNDVAADAEPEPTACGELKGEAS